ncbi:hypothetical protein JCM19047_1032 [Bacillus sp. JCM 19047]|nr:hypothetical protein JCM19047_1032 [Bacillus sp. JCM 19047]
MFVNAAYYYQSAVTGGRMLKKEEIDNYKENIRLFAAKTRFVKHGTLAFLGGGA